MAKRAAMEEAKTPISSMIDIVFLLIIFFIVQAAMEKEIEDEAVNLAFAPHGKPLKKKDPRSMVINVHKDGKVKIGMVEGMSPQQVSAALSNAAAHSGKDMPIVIRGDANVQHEYIKKVTEAITNTGLYKVKFMAVLEDDKPKK